MRFVIILLSIFILLISCQSAVFDFDITIEKYDKVLIVEANPRNGFNWPYLLYIPQHLKESDKEAQFLVFPNNTGKSTDDFNFHKSRTINKLSNRFGYFKDTELGFIGLSPVLPRFSEKLGGWKYYTHTLDRDTILCEEEDLKRLDLQLIKMIEDAKLKIIKNLNIKIKEKIFMFGFSASAHFVNRFSILHPNLVRAYAVGGFNGHLMLPIYKYEGRNLIYPVGVYDYESIIGDVFKLEEYKNIYKFIYLGNKDTNDDVPFSDGYDDPERLLIYHIFGEIPENTPIAKRLSKLELIFNQYDLNKNSLICVYENKGHEITKEMYNDIKMFFLNIKNTE